MRGTPLKKFGCWQVTCAKWDKTPGYGAYHVYNLETGDSPVYSMVKASAYYAAEKLASGVPLYTPKEAMDQAIALYPSLYPSRLQYYDHTYLVLGNGLEWVQGGLCGRDVTHITPEGVAYKALHKMMRDKGPEKYHLDESLVFGPTEKMTQDGYADGTWPDVLGPCPVEQPEFLCGLGLWGRTHLYPIEDSYTQYVPMGLLAAPTLNESLTASPPTEEWLEDARKASKLLIKYGTSKPEYVNGRRDSVKTLKSWAKILHNRYGGQWEPEETT